jgi:hypothetical protein
MRALHMIPIFHCRYLKLCDLPVIRQILAKVKPILSMLHGQKLKIR